MKQLLILSGKGGTGKTTVATAFIKLAKARVYADCDVDAPNLHLLMNTSNRWFQKDFNGMDKAKIDTSLCTMCGICYEHCRFDAITFSETYHIDSLACEGCGVCVALCPSKAIVFQQAKAGDLLLAQGETIFSTAQLSMGNGTSGLLVTEVKKQMLTEAKAHEEMLEDVIIIDGSPGIGCPVIASLSGVDMVLIVAEPTITGISDMKRMMKTAAKFGVKMTVCVNKYDVNLVNTMKIKTYCKENNIAYVGEIPYDHKAVWCINQGMSIVDVETTAGEATKKVYQLTMEELCNEQK